MPTVWKKIYPKPRPKAFIDPSLLRFGTKDCRIFNVIRVPLVEKYPMRYCDASYNDWCLSHSFEHQDSRYLIPSFLANDAAFMFTWEIRPDAFREPTKAWKGKYCVWYLHRFKEDGEMDEEKTAFYLMKLFEKPSSRDEPTLYKSVTMPRHIWWWDDEMAKIRKFLADVKCKAIWKSEDGSACVWAECEM